MLIKPLPENATKLEVAQHAVDACEQFIELADLTDPIRRARIYLLRDLFEEVRDQIAAGEAPPETSQPDQALRARGVQY